VRTRSRDRVGTWRSFFPPFFFFVFALHSLLYSLGLPVVFPRPLVLPPALSPRSSGATTESSPGPIWNLIFVFLGHHPSLISPLASRQAGGAHSSGIPPPPTPWICHAPIWLFCGRISDAMRHFLFLPLLPFLFPRSHGYGISSFSLRST